MQLILERTTHNINSTEGKLYVNGIFFCYTIEDVIRARPGEWKKELKVYSKTAIPYGVYPILVTWSNRFKRMLTGVFDVPDFSGIRVHNGSSELSSAGCIIVSYKSDNEHDKLINEKSAMNDLCVLIKAVQEKE